MKTLTENTMIPIGLAILAIGGGASWLTVLMVKINNAEAKLQEVQSKQDAYIEKMNAIQMDVRVIKVVLNTKALGHE
jgi:hypothetical protein